MEQGIIRETPTGQQGSVLVLCLLFLLVLTVLGIAATTNTLVQERMAGGERDMNLAFQAAESGLRGGEVWLQQQLVQPIPKDGPCTPACDVWIKGDVPDLILDVNNPTPPPVLDWVNDAREYGQPLIGLTANEVKPRYVIEYEDFEPDSLTVGIGVPTGRTLYKVSARGRGANTRYASKDQSIYARQF